MIYFIVLICMLFFSIYLFEVKKVKFNTRLIFIISIFSSLSYVLNMVKFIRMPQGGSITLFSMLPVMIISFVYGKGVGLTSGLLLGILKMLDGIVFVHPLQFVLDYILCNMSLGFSCIFGMENKFKMFLGCISSGFLSVMFNVLSGVLFFGEFVPNEMNSWIYSIIYNFSSVGVEVLLTTILILFIPIQRIIKVSNGRR